LAGGGDQDKDVVFLLAYLPSGGVEQVEDLVENVRVDPHGATAGGGQAQYVVGASLDGLDQPERQPAAARPGGQADAVGHLVAGEGEGGAEQHGAQQRFAGWAGGARRVVFIDDLRDDETLKQVHPPVVRALGGDPASLGSRVHIERRYLP